MNSLSENDTYAYAEKRHPDSGCYLPGDTPSLRGLLSITPAGEIKELATVADETPIKYADDLVKLSLNYGGNMAHITTRRNRLMSAVAVIMILGVALSVPSVASAAKPQIVAVEGVSYNVDASMGDNLKALNGKRVYVTLNSGKTFTGLIKKVGAHLVHIEKLVGKEYFDALIRIEDISAIDTMFRKLQR